MKTHIDIDEALLTEAMKIGRFGTKKDAVNEALAAYVRQMKRQELLALRGKVRWDADLDALRAPRPDAAR